MDEPFHSIQSTVQNVLNSINGWHVLSIGAGKSQCVLSDKCSLTIITSAVYISYKILHQLILWPYLLSPLRNAPGPPLGSPLLGQFPKILHGEAGIPQREWAKSHGPSIRVVGPFGVERMMFLSPSALQKILVSDWIEYPRVRLTCFINATRT